MFFCDQIDKFIGCVGQDHDKATAAPKFGNWDVTDPKSGEGYTTMFSKIKEERKNMSSHISPSLNKRSNINNQYAATSSSNLSKVNAI